MDENREISSAPLASCEGRSVKAQSRTTDVHVLEKLDCAAVPVSLPNKGGQLPAEVGEGRAQMKENIDQSRVLLTQSGRGMSQSMRKVAFWVSKTGDLGIRSGLGNVDHDFATNVAGLDMTQGRCGFAQRVGAVDNGNHFASLD